MEIIRRVIIKVEFVKVPRVKTFASSMFCFDFDADSKNTDSINPVKNKKIIIIPAT